MFPSILSTFTNPLPTQFLNSPSHSSIESAQNNAIAQLENVIGVEGSSSTVGSLEYLIKSPASNGGGHVQTAVTGGTGQTNYIKGDMLVAQSPSVFSKLAVGSNGLVLVADSNQATGVRWGSGGIPTVRMYTNASVLTWTKPSTLGYIIVTAIGGGGSGGGTTATTSAGGGGGGGGYAQIKIIASNLGTNVQVNVGGSVLGGTGDGVAGKYSGFGSFVSVLGGGAGAQGTASGAVAGGAGGTATGGDIIVVGGQGGVGGADAGTSINIAIAGPGGSTPLGFGGALAVAANAGVSSGSNGGNYGGGGSGGATADTTDVSGGNGAQGIVIVEEY